ncbi:MAG TPA: winged helix-turn-helix transcriptional regulator [Methanocella sp.]|nr:winged helix-turn-helix transcriptional regulator [Methanocella sp.]
MDETDLQLVQVIVSNSRMPYRELADRLELSVTTVHKRIQALADRGFINKFTVYPSPKILPWMFVSVTGHSRVDSLDEAIGRVGRHPITERIAPASGDYLFVDGVVRDISEVSRYVDFVVREASIAEPYVSLHDHSYLFGPGNDRFTITDFKILSRLLDDSRKQAVDLSIELGVSVSTVRRRLDRMQKNRMILCTMHLDPSKSGDVFVIFLLTLRNGGDRSEVVKKIREQYKKNLISLWVYDTMPDLININIWAKTMAEMKALRESLQREDLFKKIVPIIPYEVKYYDTWLTRYIRDMAASAE